MNHDLEQIKADVEKNEKKFKEQHAKILKDFTKEYKLDCKCNTKMEDYKRLQLPPQTILNMMGARMAQLTKAFEGKNPMSIKEVDIKKEIEVIKTQFHEQKVHGLTHYN